MIKLDSNNISAIIGVFGTLFGVILGAILNQLTRIGKIKVYQNSIELSILEQTNIGGFQKTTSITEKTHSISISLNLDFYNTSPNSIKIARNIVFLVKSKKTYFRNDLFDSDTRHSSGVIIQSDKLKNINLTQNQVINYNLILSTRDNLKEIIEGDWYIEYHDNNDRIKRIRINKNRL